ncbi:MAG: 1-acyl-sn-glycerol-3-phosphate acyltransferase [Ruminococcaceae bacterium]|nr:1-acyl-sn-glycerol-3-phosphate acyltransferase [Oscillospiraceae bacterium]
MRIIGSAKKKYPRRTEYFTDYKTDFDHKSYKAVKIGKDYPYLSDKRGDRLKFSLLYGWVMTPIALLHTYLFSRTKVIGRDKLKDYRGKGFFLYGNHTSPISDAFAPGAIAFPTSAHTVISSKNMSIPVLGRLLRPLGAIPLPTDPRAARGFTEAVKKRISERRAVVIYPEGHLWPFMKDLRPFGSELLSLPDKLGAAVFTMTRVYKKRGRSFRCELYIDGPFLPDRELCPKDSREKLYREVRCAMESRCSLSDIEIIEYKKENNKDE